MGKREEGRGKREEGRGKREEGREKREESSGLGVEPFLFYLILPCLPLNVGALPCAWESCERGEKRKNGGGTVKTIPYWLLGGMGKDSSLRSE